MGQPDWVPAGIDIDRPNPARAYDYLLGGSHNFAVDRAAARRALGIMPGASMQAQANRAFLFRVVRYLADSGVRQFLDLGSGIPTVGNVHEVAQQIAPESRVVYVDVEPVAVAHARQILADNDRATCVRADVRDIDTVLGHPEVCQLLDFRQPVAVLMIALLHYVVEPADPHALVAGARSRLAPGSFLVITHPTHENSPEWVRLAAVSRQGPSPVEPRTGAEIARFFTGFELVEPGLVWVPQWRPEDPDDVGERPESTSLLAGVGRLG